jgi:hypothetical protein
MWENELIMFRFGFYLLIAIVLLLLVTLIRSHLDHEELVDVLRSLPTQCNEDSEKEGDS